MIESESGFVGITVLRCRGVVPASELFILAGEASDSINVAPGLLMLDWSKVEHWPYAHPAAQDLAAWQAASTRIARVAIVHDRRLNPQAAWLGAALRGQAVTVRSWPPRQIGIALEWLKAGGVG